MQRPSLVDFDAPIHHPPLVERDVAHTGLRAKILEMNPGLRLFQRLQDLFSTNLDSSSLFLFFAVDF
jgi:hypothetical protein